MLNKLKAKYIPNLFQLSKKANNNNFLLNIKFKQISYINFNSNNNNLIRSNDGFGARKNQNSFYLKRQNQNNSFYKLSKRHLMDKDYSHLHVERTDKIYPKIKKYEYDFDLEKTDPILNEFNFHYELEDWDEALNKGFELLNLFETNPNAKIQTINLCLFLADTFLKQEKYENAAILLNKAEKRLDLKLFKKLEEEGLHYKYSVRLSLLKGIAALRTQKDKDGIVYMKQALEIIEKQKLLELQGNDSSISIASDYLTILLLQAQILLKSKINDKYNSKIAEGLEFFKKRKSNVFNLDVKRMLIDNILIYSESFKNNLIDNTNNNNKNNIINFAVEGLNLIEKLIPEIRNRKTRDEFYLRFNLIWMFLQAQKQIEPKSFLKKMDKFIDILNKLDLDPKLIESSKLDVANLKNSICFKSIQRIENEKAYDHEFYRILLNNKLDILKILKNQTLNNNDNSDFIVDNNFLSNSLLNFYEVYANVKNNKMQGQIEQIISSSKNKLWDENLTHAFIENLNYNLLYLKNTKIIEDLININKGSISKNKEAKELVNEFDNKYNEELRNQKLEELNKQNELDFNGIMTTTNFIQREKLKSLSGDVHNLNRVKKISKFLEKELSLLVRDRSIKNKTKDKLDNLILSCFLFDNCKNKNLSQIQKLNKEIKKFFVINNKETVKTTSRKLNRNMSLSDIKIEMFNLSQIIKGCFETDVSITPKTNLIDNYRVYSEEEIRKIIFTVLAISNSYSKLAEENYCKLLFSFNEKNYDKNDYFKNQFTTRHNLAHKKVNFYLNLSLQLIQMIFSTKNDSIRILLNSSEANDTQLIKQLKKLIAFNLITKSYTALYFSNIDLKELLKVVNENKAFLGDFLHEAKNDKLEIQNELEKLVDILDKNING